MLNLKMEQFTISDAFGRTTPQNKYLNKNIDETHLGRNDFCGCGSGKKYKSCCLNIPFELRTTWSVVSIRERNLMFCKCIRDVLGLDSGKTWLDVRKELSDNHIKKIYEFYSILWPRETDVYSLLPKSDGKFRGLYSGSLDIRTISINALPMASMFDELLIETPITNPNNVKPEFSPIDNPSKYKYQALKDLLFMLQLEPCIDFGLVNLIPDPAEFDMPLMRAVMDISSKRGMEQGILNEQDRLLHFQMCIEDLLNSTYMLPREEKIQFLINQFGLDNDHATQMIDLFEQEAESSPLVILQQANIKDSGQIMLSRMGPNYEMALLIAQVTGSVIVTDSGSRWKELMAAQHRSQGIVNYPWNDSHTAFRSVPIDEKILDTFRKSQGDFSTARKWLKTMDQMVVSNNRDPSNLANLAGQASDLMRHLEQVNDQVLLSQFRISSPEGGFHDVNVQRLLARSSCLRYDRYVRSVYGISIQD